MGLDCIPYEPFRAWSSDELSAVFEEKPQGSALWMNSPPDEDDDYSTFEVEHSSIQVHWNESSLDNA